MEMVIMLNRKAKEILRAIQKDAGSYYVILETYWPQGNKTSKFASEMGANEEIWNDIYKLDKRYRRFHNYVKEVKPQWRKVRDIPYGDNSVERIEVNQYGEERTRMISAPSGDIC